MSSAVPNLSHTEMKSLQGSQHELWTQDLLLFSLIALMNSVNCSSNAPQSRISSRSGSLAILSWYLLMACAAQTCASIVTSFSKFSTIPGPCSSHFLHPRVDSLISSLPAHCPSQPHTRPKNCNGIWTQQCRIFCLICHREALSYIYVVRLFGLSSLRSEDSHATSIFIFPGR